MKRRRARSRNARGLRREKGILTGLDVLVEERFRLLKGMSVGLICNPTSLDARFRHAADLLNAAAGVHLVALFGPEHGVRGDTPYMENVVDERDARTGVPAYSLYGTNARSLRPRPEQLRGLDALVFDIQDVGARYYTYQATMLLCMEAANEAALRFVVLDRPNPVGGQAVEGPSLREGFESFCGMHDLAPRHGMTVGELADMFRAERALDRLELDVVECRGWRRSMYQRDTGMPWVLPSPNMPTPETALVYPGMCLLEGTNLSEGRGTTKPFELFGAPWLEPDLLARALLRHRLPGVRFRSVHFVPSADKHRGEPCRGLELHVVDRESFRPFRTAAACIIEARAQRPEMFQWRTEPYEFVEGIPAIDLLCGSDRERKAIEAGEDLDKLARAWVPEERRFANRRQAFLRYD